MAAALKRLGHSVNLLHLTHSVQREKYQAKMLSFGNPGIIGFSITSNMWPYAKEWIRWTRAQFSNTVIICGGVHPTLNPEEVIADDGVDAICVGEGEEALVELCEKLRNGQDIMEVQNIWIKDRGKIYRNPVRPPLKNLDSLPFPDREIFDYQKLYHERMNEASVMASRGCPYRCSYCCNEALWEVCGKTAYYVRFRSVENFLKELKEIIGNYSFIKGFAFDDDILPLNIKWFKEFADEYKKEIDLPFTCNVRPDLINENIVSLLKKAGCWRVHMGIESGNDKIRNEILNRNITREQIVKAFSLCKKSGIELHSYNMIGLPKESMPEILDTVKLNARVNAGVNQVSIFYPYKKTRLHDYCQKKGLISQRVVTNYFEDTKLELKPFERSQILFSLSHFGMLVSLYHILFKLPNALSNVAIKILDGLFCSRIGFKVSCLIIKLAKAVWSGAIYPVYKLLRKVYGKANRILTLAGLGIYSIALYIFKYRKFKAIPSVKKGFNDHKANVHERNDRYIAIFKRLLDSYNKAKAEQKNVDQPYRVGRMWQDMIDRNFEDLVTSLRNKDTVKLQALLENFEREKFTIGISGAIDYYAMKKNPLYKYQFVNTWYKHYDTYKERARNYKQLTYPMLGNPAGLYHDGQVIPLDVIAYHYYAIEILSLLAGVDNPLVCEIGGGHGAQAYKILSISDHPITYVLLDIPEVLVIASYFLMAALPEKKFLLFGEGSMDSDKLDNYDIVLMPNFMLPQLGDETVDLFYNANSFSEMDSATVEEYIHQIERICRRYFFHVNHNAKFVWYDDRKEIVNIPASQIKPDPRRFKKTYQHPRLFTRLEDKIFYYRYKAGHFAFLYGRIRSASCRR